jgi:hypothetical protein
MKGGQMCQPPCLLIYGAGPSGGLSESGERLARRTSKPPTASASATAPAIPPTTRDELETRREGTGAEAGASTALTVVVGAGVRVGRGVGVAVEVAVGAGAGVGVGANRARFTWTACEMPLAVSASTVNGCDPDGDVTPAETDNETSCGKESASSPT